MKSFTGPGSTPSRRRFWDQVTASVNASRKIPGRHVTVSEHPGKGTLINVDDTSARRAAGGTCPALNITFNGVTFDCGCWDELDGLSFEFTDGGDFNDFEIVTITDPDPPDCAICAKVHAGGDADPQLHEKVWTTPPTDCSGTPIIDSDEFIRTIVIAQVAGTWYVVARFGVVLFFFGSAPDLDSPIPNLLTSCNLTPTLLINDFTNCYGASWNDTPLVALGHGGTATVTPA